MRVYADGVDGRAHLDVGRLQCDSAGAGSGVDEPALEVDVENGGVPRPEERR